MGQRLLARQRAGPRLDPRPQPRRQAGRRRECGSSAATCRTGAAGCTRSSL